MRALPFWQQLVADAGKRTTISQRFKCHGYTLRSSIRYTTVIGIDKQSSSSILRSYIDADAIPNHFQGRDATNNTDHLIKFYHADLLRGMA